MNREKLKRDVYLNNAEQIARLSKDRNTKVGTVIVAKNGEPVSWGYNGMSNGISDKEMPQSREEEILRYTRNSKEIKFKSNKYPFISHSEANAIDFGDRMKMIGATLYTTGFPCDGCCKRIVNAKIKKVVIRSDADDPKSMLCDEKNRQIVEFHLAMAGIELMINDEEINLSPYQRYED